MIKNSIGFSQQLSSRSYSDYLSQPMQNAKTNQNTNAAIPAQSSMGQMQGGNILDSMGFASELRSQKTVSALMSINNLKTKLAPTLSEKGATVDNSGNITIPKPKNTTLTQKNSKSNTHTINSANPTNLSSPALPTQNAQNTQSMQNQRTQQTEQNIGIPMNGRSKVSSLNANPRGAISLNGMRAFALDDRSLGILSRITEKRELTLLNNTSLKSLIGKENQSNTSTKNQTSTKPLRMQALNENYSEIGKLAAQYESATKGSSVIGYDRNGGTSYGTYQISSRAGTFDEFLSFLDKESPNWAQKLRGAGKANTGSRNGSVPDEWKELCAENPEQMKKLEHDFIVKSHYEPVASHVEEKWKGNISHALREVIFSTAVQHGVGGAKHVFNQAFADTNANTKILTASNLSAEVKPTQEELIKNVYTRRSTKFGSSTLQVQEAARNRFIHEQKQALGILT